MEIITLTKLFIMRKERIKPSKAKIFAATRVEVFGSLSEKFGSAYGTPSLDSTEEHKVNFQLDRLFTIIHHN